MNFSAIGVARNAAPFPSGGYSRVRDGLRAFDSLGDEVRRRQDALERHHVSGGAGSGAAQVGLGGALAAYLSSEPGQNALRGFAYAAVGFIRAAFEDGPEQLPLPLA